MIEDPGTDTVLSDYKTLIAVMETHTDNNIVGTLSRVKDLVSEIISVGRALREDISDQVTEVGV